MVSSSQEVMQQPDRCAKMQSMQIYQPEMWNICKPPGFPAAPYDCSLYLCNSATGIFPESHLCVTFIMKTDECNETKYTYRRYYFSLGKSVS